MAEAYDRPADQPEEVEVTAILEQAELTLPDLGVPEQFKKAEIIAGALVMSPLRFAHGETIFQLQTQLAQQLPPEFWFVYDVLIPFEPKVHEFCPDLAIVPRANLRPSTSMCKPEWVEFVIEVIAPTTRDFDYGAKVAVYAKAGIPEYVIFDPYSCSATRYAQPRDGDYALRQLVRYGEPVKLELPYSVVLETAQLPAEPRS
ncbi:Uma2 family endonuclease [Actinocrinis sp.]|uniref:Uma2 family endonuclease n=1 Tax=Actinocrinis sp. TaxID=1920516 RepID=UPI002CA23EF7|nr:Uma2 family endonuclease [Actinocrinis sp.]HXR69837.1 Uma2 family endonuclease [Actinocrinis sp.]